MPDLPMTEQLLRLDDLEKRTGIGRSTIYRKIEKGTFPPPRQVGERAVAWLESEIVEWMHSLPVATSAPSDEKLQR